MFSKTEGLHLTYQQSRLIDLVGRIVYSGALASKPLPFLQEEPNSHDSWVREQYSEPLQQLIEPEPIATDLLSNSEIVQQLIDLSRAASQFHDSFRLSAQYGMKLRPFFQCFDKLEPNSLQSIEETIARLTAQYPIMRPEFKFYISIVSECHYDSIEESSVDNEMLESLAERKNQTVGNLETAVFWAFKFEQVDRLKALLNSFSFPANSLSLLLEKACASKDEEKIELLLNHINTVFGCQVTDFFAKTCDLNSLATFNYLSTKTNIEKSTVHRGLSQICCGLSTEDVYGLIEKKHLNRAQLKEFIADVTYSEVFRNKISNAIIKYEQNQIIAPFLSMFNQAWSSVREPVQQETATLSSTL